MTTIVHRLGEGEGMAKFQKMQYLILILDEINQLIDNDACFKKFKKFLKKALT